MLADCREWAPLEDAQDLISSIEAQVRYKASRVRRLDWIETLQTLILDRLVVLKQEATLDSQSQVQPKGEMEIESQPKVQPEAELKGQKETESHSHEQPNGQNEIESQSQSHDQTDIQLQPQDIVEIQLLPQESDPNIDYHIDEYSVLRDFIRQCCIVFGLFFFILFIVSLTLLIVKNKFSKAR